MILLTLFHVVIANNGGHGVLVNDQFDPSRAAAASPSGLDRLRVRRCM